MAARRLQKRGCEVEFVHFHSVPYLADTSQRKVRALIEKHSERSVRTHPSRLLKEIFVDTGYYAELVSDDAQEHLESIRYLNQFVRAIQAY